MSHFQVLQITAPSQALLRGDTEYASTLTDHLRAQGVDAWYLRGADFCSIDDKSLTREIHFRKSGAPSRQIVHLQLRPPSGGTLIKPESLKQFDHTVVTLHEFTYLHSDADKMRALEYAQAADHVVFTTPFERQAVADYVPEVWKKSSVIPVFQNVPLSLAEPSARARPNNVISFGSIRSGKGYDQVIRLARLMADDPELERRGLQVIVAGSVVDSSIARKLLQATYGLQDGDMPKPSGKKGQDRKAVVNRLADVKKDGLRSVLPMELHFDVPHEAISALFERANFAYLPIERGATNHSSAIAGVLAGGCVTITTEGSQTPEALRKTVLFASDAAEALAIVKQRLDAPQLNAQTRRKSLDYARSVSPTCAAAAYAAIYQSLANSKSQAKEPLMRAPATRDWRSRTYPRLSEAANVAVGVAF